uniref:Uncharacterized protein n=1 Tax=Ditylenchus dipsaci TaxID=166011 RepID=A0A915DUM9_9BILA
MGKERELKRQTRFGADGGADKKKLNSTFDQYRLCFFYYNIFLSIIVENMQEDELHLLSSEVEGLHQYESSQAFLTVSLLAFSRCSHFSAGVPQQYGAQKTSGQSIFYSQPYRPPFAFNYSINNSSSGSGDLSPFFRRHPLVANLDCSRLLNNDKNYIRRAAKSRISYKDDPVLPMDWLYSPQTLLPCSPIVG